MKKLQTLVCLFAVASNCILGKEISEATVAGVNSFYTSVLSSFAPTNVPFRSEYEGPLRLTRQYRKPFSYYPSVLFINAQFDLQITDEDTPQLIALRNHKLRWYIDTNSVQRIPLLTPQKAIEHAQHYLNRLGVSTTTGMAIKTITFNQNDNSSWEVKWEPMLNRTRYDSFDVQYEQHITISFHESYGFVGYEWRLDFPAPRNMVVRISQTDAIGRAMRVVSRIQQSPYYLQCRVPGFVVSGLHKAELLIAAPNWLLDPERAVWLRDKPPEETRLCWVVTFTSVYAGKEEPGAMLVPPMFLVYIDAATGEIVGANFT